MHAAWEAREPQDLGAIFAVFVDCLVLGLKRRGFLRNKRSADEDDTVSGKKTNKRTPKSHSGVTLAG